MSCLFRLYKLLMKKGKNHIKVSSTNILCSESNGSQGWLPLQVKIETEARFLAKRPDRGYWRPHKQKIFLLLTFISFINIVVKKTFITYKKQEAKICSVVKVMEASDSFYYRQNLRLQAQILAKRPAGATGDLTNRTYFCFLLFIP